MDRNNEFQKQFSSGEGSLSARRAWIEIFDTVSGTCRLSKSLSARRAWIEIVKLLLISSELIVALRKESVDRNAEKMKVGGIDVCRSPQGERG